MRCIVCIAILLFYNTKLFAMTSTIEDSNKSSFRNRFKLNTQFSFLYINYNNREHYFDKEDGFKRFSFAFTYRLTDNWFVGYSDNSWINSTALKLKVLSLGRKVTNLNILFASITQANLYNQKDFLYSLGVSQSIDKYNSIAFFVTMPSTLLNTTFSYGIAWRIGLS